jgi:hypothetical protein
MTTRLLICALACLAPALLPAGETRVPTAEEVAALQAKYRAEHDALIKAGAGKRYLPGLIEQAELIAGRAGDSLKAGRLMQAAAGFRLARWQLPYNPPEVPPHTARVFGNLRLRHSNEVNAASFSPDGKFLATAGRDRTVRLWDLANGHEALIYKGHPDAVRCVAYAPDG